MSQFHRSTTAALLGLLTILALGGCDDGPRTPTEPGGPIVVDSFQTAVQPAPGGGARVQVRARVQGGLDALSAAAFSGAARGRVCLSGSCDEGPLTTGASEGTCTSLLPVQVASTELGLAAAWLDGDVVGIDFCVRNVTEEATFQILVTDGLSPSNVIQTICTPDGGLLFCGSG